MVNSQGELGQGLRVRAYLVEPVWLLECGGSQWVELFWYLVLEGDSNGVSYHNDRAPGTCIQV